jgi:hypothetical protein
MTSLSLPGNRTLWLEEAAKGFKLEPTLGGARLELSVKAWASEGTPATPLLLSAALLVGKSTGYNLQELVRLSTDGMVHTSTQPNRIALTGHVSGQALLEAEELRAGGPLWLVLRGLRGTTVAGEPAGLVEATPSGELMVEVLSEEWGTQLEKVSAASYMALISYSYGQVASSYE